MKSYYQGTGVPVWLKGRSQGTKEIQLERQEVVVSSARLHFLRNKWELEASESWTSSCLKWHDL